jgi:branched-chain amino acid transport system substrate-binding protein
MGHKRLLTLGFGFILVLVLITTLFLVGCSSSTPTSSTSAPATTTAPTSAANAPKTLLIGVNLDLTGFFSGLDQVDVDAAQIMAEYINQNGGIKVQGQTYNVKLVVEDGQSSLDGVASAANKLVFNDKVQFVLGPQAFLAPAAAKVFNDNKIFYACNYITLEPGIVDATTPYAWSAYDGAPGQIIAGIKFLKQYYPNVKVVAPISPDDGAIQYLSPVVKQVLTENGMTMTSTYSGYANETTDFNPIATKLSALKPDAILHVNGTPQHVGGILKGLRDSGSKIPYAAACALNLIDVQSVAGKAETNDIFCIGVMNGAPDNSTLLKYMLDKTYAKDGQGITTMFEAAQNLWALKQLIEAANSLDTTAVKAQLEKTESIDSLIGKTGTKAYNGGDKTYGIAHHGFFYPEPMQYAGSDGVIKWGGWQEIGVLP